jgi:hypothetical protein
MATGSMSTGRDAHTATLLSSGKVLVAGGLGDNGYLSSAELYDPAEGSWSDTRSMRGFNQDRHGTDHDHLYSLGMLK